MIDGWATYSAPSCDPFSERMTAPGGRGNERQAGLAAPRSRLTIPVALSPVDQFSLRAQDAAVRKHLERGVASVSVRSPLLGQPGSALGVVASAASLTSSLIASRITRVVSSSRCASSSFDSARYSGHSVPSWKVFGARTITELRR